MNLVSRFTITVCYTHIGILRVLIDDKMQCNIADAFSYNRGVNFFNSNTEIQRFNLSEDDAVRQLSDGDETNFKVRIPGGMIVETGISMLLR